jgi:hypothetical protein
MKQLHTSAFITGNGLFMLMFSMLVMVAGAIILFYGASNAIGLITAAGLVVMIAGLVLFGASAGYIISQNAKS